MDSRLIFLHFHAYPMGGRIVQLIESLGMRLRARRGDSLANPGIISLVVIVSFDESQSKDRDCGAKKIL